MLYVVVLLIFWFDLVVRLSVVVVEKLLCMNSLFNGLVCVCCVICFLFIFSFFCLFICLFVCLCVFRGTPLAAKLRRDALYEKFGFLGTDIVDVCYIAIDIYIL